MSSTRLVLLEKVKLSFDPLLDHSDSYLAIFIDEILGNMCRRQIAKEGGMEVVEITNEDALRVRAERCNYADGVPLNECVLSVALANSFQNSSYDECYGSE
jgi:hypothetical protein